MTTDVLRAGAVSAPAPVAETATSHRPRLILVAIVLAIGAIASGAFSVWHPEPDANDDFTYSIIEPIRDEWWAWHVFGGLATAAAAVALAIAVSHLAARRGAVLATIGGAITVLGGLAFAAAMAAEGILGAYVTEPDALSAEQGTQLMQYVNDNLAPLGVVLFPGFILLGVGALLLAIALWRAGSVPRWFAIAFALANVAGAVVPFGTLLDIVTVAFTLTLLGVAWFTVSPLRSRGSTVASS